MCSPCLAEESGFFFLVIGLGLVGFGVWAEVKSTGFAGHAFAALLILYGAWWLYPVLWFMVEPTRLGQRVSARSQARTEARADREEPSERRFVAKIVGLGCLVIAAIWVVPNLSSDTEDVSGKAFWTGIVVVFVAIIFGSFIADERRRSKQARWRSDVESWKSEVERFEQEHPGVEVVPAARGFVISVGYHGLARKDLDSVLSEGLLRDRTESYGCQQGGHVALAGTPEIAANFGDVILEVIMDDLEERSLWYGGENRVHGDIEPSRLRVYEQDVTPGWEGYIDPAKTPLGNFPACCFPWRLEGFDLDKDYRETTTSA